jgi:hypothetical protein
MLAAGVRRLLRCTYVLGLRDIHPFAVHDKETLRRYSRSLDVLGRGSHSYRAYNHCDVVAPGDQQALEIGGERD